MINKIKGLFASVQPSQHYLPHIDGMRAFAVLIVVLFHAFPHSLKGGFIGVDVFFVISGYLISGIMFNDIKAHRYSIKRFYERRINRIFPSLIAVIFSCIVVSKFLMFKEEILDFNQSVIFSAAFAANIFFYLNTDYFAGAAEDNPLLHLWSLGVEEQFYILWPLLLAYITFKTKDFALKFIGFIILSSFIINIYLTQTNHNAAFYFPFGRFWELAVGALFAALNLWCAESINKYKKYSDLFVAMGLALIVFGVLMIDPSKSFPGFYALIPVASASLLIVFGGDSLFGKHLLSNRVLVFLGIISYPLYLWHWPVLSFLHLHEGLATREARLGAVIVSILLAALTYYLVEKPLRFKVKSPLKPFALFGVMIVLCGYVVIDFYQIKSATKTSQDAFISFYKNYVFNSDYLIKNRLDCGYLNTSGTLRDSIPMNCYSGTKKETVMLWGDSHAYQFYYGLKQTLPESVNLLQIASSGCSPMRPDQSVKVSRECLVANKRALEKITQIKPAVLILAQRMGHETVDWEGLAAYLHKSGIEHVILLGPVPQWKQYLYRFYASHHIGQDFSMLKPDEYLSQNLDNSLLEVDKVLSNKYLNSSKLKYISPTAFLCNSSEGCKSTVLFENKVELTTFDYGHLTLSTSKYIATKLVIPEIRSYFDVK